MTPGRRDVPCDVFLPKLMRDSRWLTPHLPLRLWFRRELVGPDDWPVWLCELEKPLTLPTKSGDRRHDHLLFDTGGLGACTPLGRGRSQQVGNISAVHDRTLMWDQRADLRKCNPVGLGYVFRVAETEG